MASPAFPDPFQIWREALSKLENDANALATGSMKSQEVLQSLHQFSSVWLSMQQVFDKTIEDYLRRANLPSRKEVAELAVSLKRIEDKLDRLLPPDASGMSAPRPARTRRPPGAASPSEPVAPAKETRRGARTDKG
ncbi:Poly(hydroxyalcanoate) granule associated protein (phasin) [Caballeronia choica]|jgi:hypothetical protein|uniref:Poly(Hydroxyalcanoate) granule associated protein (Phasin) n=1 Tax=Caballeronia choica TaxID=326476 RepID=A0A158IX96_9BURK|nr:hypothetical protein [Caballeronia choica]SAL60883.1 Poly(hydroxyalcanoate) granule associated protein (phasin) [Caballeronia choica]